MRNILDQSIDILDSMPEESLLFCWSGVYFDLKHKLVRADKTFLNVILRRHNAGKEEYPMFLRCPPCICSGGTNGHAEPYLSFSLSTVFRITDGERRGKVVRAKDVRKAERYRDAGLKKWLRTGNSPDCFSSRRKGDQVVIELLENLCTQKRVREANPLTTAPLFYTCKRDTDRTMPRIRRDQDTLEFLRGFSNYDPILTSDQNARILRDEITMDVGAGQVAFPFSCFYGQGVLAADFSDIERPFGTWYRVLAEEFEQTSPYLEFVD